MKRIITTLALTLALTGCVSFVDTLGTVQDAAVSARLTFQPVVDAICRDFAEQCKEERKVMFVDDLAISGACDAFEVCDQVRENLITTFEHIHLLIADASMSYALKDVESAEEAIAKALVLIGDVRNQLRALGYL